MRDSGISVAPPEHPRQTAIKFAPPLPQQSTSHTRRSDIKGTIDEDNSSSTNDEDNSSSTNDEDRSDTDDEKTNDSNDAEGVEEKVVVERKEEIKIGDKGKGREEEPAEEQVEENVSFPISL
jgi:hypothetical protein